MEGKFNNMLLKNEAKRRHLPHSLTSEMEEAYEEKAKQLNDGLKDCTPSYNKTRELV
jgi:hypothetical protein